MSIIESPRDELNLLRDLCGGAVALPGDEGYDAARSGFNLSLDQRPAAVVYPADAGEVADVVRAARRAGLRVAGQSTGHNAGPLGDLSATVLVKTSGMGGVSIDAADRIARVGAGVVWEDVVDAAAPHGLLALHGSSPTVGVAGYSLGGGMGWLARSHGLQTNSLTAIELVTADGELVRTDAENDPELFWALRGGGGNFGIVTALEFRLYEITEIYAGLHGLGLERGRASCRSTRGGRLPRRTTSPRRSASCSCRRCRRSPSRSAAARSSSSTAPSRAIRR